MPRLLLLIFSLLFPLSVTAQSCGTEDLIDSLSSVERARLDALIAPHPYPTGNLWRAEKDGSTVTVVGTIHIPDPRLKSIVETLRPSLDAAELLILEASSDDEAGIQALATTQPGMFFITEGPTLIDLLTEDEWTRVSERITALGVPAFLASKFQPWYLSLTLAIPPCAMAALQSGDQGLDRQLETIAQANGTPVGTLDNVETLLRLFADEPIEKQLDGLRITLETQAGGDATTSTLIESYFDGRVRESWEFSRILIEQTEIENGPELFEEVNQTLLLDRNQDWEPKIVEMVAGKDVVLAVGAAHLSGETGVLRALERAGYTLTQLP
ncbi:TraB/GumN family protein [Rhodobacteraceae bacterium]|nr:TraB/GumN family protein [Paracoccaceae bacterium]